MEDLPEAIPNHFQILWEDLFKLYLIPLKYIILAPNQWFWNWSHQDALLTSS